MARVAFDVPVVERSEHGGPGEHGLYEQSDGTVVDLEHGWDVAVSQCESGADERTYSSVAISWQVNRPGAWADRAFATLTRGCPPARRKRPRAGRTGSLTIGAMDELVVDDDCAARGSSMYTRV